MKKTTHSVGRWRHRSFCQRYTGTPALIALPAGKKTKIIYLSKFDVL